MRRTVRLLVLPLTAGAVSFVGLDAEASLDQARTVAVVVRCPPPEPIDISRLISRLQTEQPKLPSLERGSFSSSAH